MNRRFPLTMCTALALAAAPAGAGVIFSDNFDLQNSGNGVLNFSSFSQWTVQNGTVDLIGNGYFDFFPGKGLYIDLDGSTRKAGLFSTIELSLAPGVYELAFALGGNQRGYADDTVSVTFGGYSESFTLPSSQGLTLFTRSVSFNAPTRTRLSFQNAGGDNVGAVLDDVRIVSIPSPSGGVLLASVGLVMILKRRR